LISFFLESPNGKKLASVQRKLNIFSM